MAYTYTRTLTKQERLISDLIDSFDQNFQHVLFGLKSIYRVERDNGQPMMNMYDDGMLYGEDFKIIKSKGQGIYTYIDDVGTINVFGDDYAKAQVNLSGVGKVDLMHFYQYPEIEEYISSIINKLQKKEQKTM